MTATRGELNFVISIRGESSLLTKRESNHSALVETKEGKFIDFKKYFLYFVIYNFSSRVKEDLFRWKFSKLSAIIFFHSSIIPSPIKQVLHYDTGKCRCV